MMVNVDVKGWHDNDNGSCNGNDNEKSDRVGSTRRREPIRLRGLGCCRAPIVRSKTVVWGTFHIHCPPAQTAIVAIIIVFVIDTQYIKRFEETSVLYLLGCMLGWKLEHLKCICLCSCCMIQVACSAVWVGNENFEARNCGWKWKWLQLWPKSKLQQDGLNENLRCNSAPPHIIYHSPSLRLQVGPCITCSTYKSQTTLSS